ncbi:hypothetical protein BHE74_00013910, partial [Ensete ventricosum]
MESAWLGSVRVCKLICVKREEVGKLGRGRLAYSGTRLGRVCSGTHLGRVCSGVHLMLLHLGVCRGILHEALDGVGAPD